jgi:GGDEF domain-containing protein
VPRRLLEQASVPQQLLGASAVGYVLVFAALAAYGAPGRGLGNTLYLPIILAALATGPGWGAVAGLVAIAVYWAGMFVGPSTSWSQVLSIGGGVRLLSYIAAGSTVGYFARRARDMMGHSLHLLDELLLLASRDLTTGVSSARGFEAAVNRRLADKRPFVLLVGASPGFGRRQHDVKLRRIAALLSARLDRDDELARIGDRHFALLLPCAHTNDAAVAGARLERALDGDGLRMTFGWAVHPLDGSDLLSLFRAADERLYARKAVRGEWRPTAASAGLVEDLDRLRAAGDA